MSSQTIALLAPEIVLVAAAIGILLAGAFPRFAQLSRAVAWAAPAPAAVVLWRQHRETLGHRGVVIDGLSPFLRWLAVGGGAVFLWFGGRPWKGKGKPG